MTELVAGTMRSEDGGANRDSLCMLRMLWLSQLTSSWRRLSCAAIFLYSSESLKLLEQQLGA